MRADCDPATLASAEPPGRNGGSAPQPCRTSGDTAQLRRRLGPVAWCALECLLERSRNGIAEVSVRALSVELGVAKNTAHRAVTALRPAGLIDHVQGRRADGRFQPGRYRLLPGISATDVPAALVRAPRHAPATVTATSPAAGIQLNLLDRP